MFLGIFLLDLCCKHLYINEPLVVRKALCKITGQRNKTLYNTYVSNLGK